MNRCQVRFLTAGCHARFPLPEGSVEPEQSLASGSSWCEDSGPHITTETTNLLRVRLRAAALCLLIGFAAFFLWRLTDGVPGLAEHGCCSTPTASVLCVLGACWLSLCRQCSISQFQLRFYEILIFAAPALYLLLVEYAADHRLRRSAAICSIPSRPGTR